MSKTNQTGGWWGFSKSHDSEEGTAAPTHQLAAVPPQSADLGHDLSSQPPINPNNSIPSLVNGGEPKSIVKEQMNPTKTTNTDSDAFLPAGMEIEGTVKTDRPLTINGKVRGNVISTSHVLIGDSGEVEANVQCGKLDVYGNLSGDVTATDHVGLYKGGRMLGKITAPNLLTESGAYFKGTVEMTDGGNIPPAKA